MKNNNLREEEFLGIDDSFVYGFNKNMSDAIKEAERENERSHVSGEVLEECGGCLIEADGTIVNRDGEEVGSWN